ncbi:hypothetical protein BDV97DRAFT_61268 [Delphinella strobiligena]|nr:hypothetical protein BDV97DRAFT_61268 [Delphinella strobiligena]
MSALTKPDVLLEDQRSLAELKLKRQQQRISDNDAALLAAKTKSGSRKPKIEWKPFNLTNSSDEIVSMSDSADSRLLTPFDVHAKEFKPITTSRESSASRASVHGRVRGVTFNPPSPLEDDDEGGFQLVTGRKMKPPTKPALGLNAYDTKTTSPTKLPTVAGSYDKKEINEVFGNELPPPEFVQGYLGYEDGQVQFVMHPNGDVAAQQWSNEKYQWNNIGHYSNIRRRREGLLAAARLKHETEQQMVMQNSLAYFRAVAKQREALDMGLPWGPKEVNAILPVPAAVQASIHPSIPPPAIPRRDPFRPFAMATEPPVVPKLLRDDTQSSLDSMTFGVFSATSLRGGRETELEPAPARAAHPTRNAIAVPLSNAAGNAYSPWSLHRSPPIYSDPVPWRPSEIANTSSAVRPTQFVPTTPAFEPNTGKSVAETIDLSAYENLEGPAKYCETSFDRTWQNRSAVKDYLNRLGETASARGQNLAARTVLHDPLRSQSITSYSQPPERVRTTEGSRFGTTMLELESRSFSSVSPYDNGQAEVMKDLVGVSEPDPGPWNARVPDVVDVKTPSLSHEQLALYSRPTPQNWNGPFFAGSPEEGANKKSHDEELRDWFFGGNTRARQEEFYQRIKAAHISNATRKHPPGPIGPIGSKSTPRHKRSESVDFNEGTTRLLIPVLENLASYVEGPEEKRHGPFARFAPPPEWCIDRTAGGNKSFFVDDWGQPPERIGRDSRYRPMVYEGRFGSANTGFDLPPAIGTLTALGRSVKPLDGRYKFGSGRKW